MKKKVHSSIIVIHLVMMTICFDAFSQNQAISVSGDENWDEPFGSSGMNGEVNCFVKKDGILYAGGEYTKAGGNDIGRIAKWDGTSWSSVGVGFDENAVYSVAFYDSELYAGGIFYHSNGQTMHHFAKWNGTEWVQPGSAIDLGVYCLASSGNGLYLGGGLVSTAGIELHGIARWDGTQYFSLAGGFWQPYGETPNATDMEIIGNDLYVVGEFTKAGGIDAANIARWDGSAWAPVGGGIICDDCVPTSLAVIGNDLYVAGGFTVAGGVEVNNIAKWDGTQWSPLGSGTNAAISSLAVIGDKLFAGGFFTTAGGVNASKIAMWDGTQWSPLGSGMNDWVKTLYADGDILYAGGRFTKAGNKTAKYIARWHSALSVEENGLGQEEALFYILPNPTHGKFQITSTKHQTNSKIQIQNCEVVDLYGKVIKEIVCDLNFGACLEFGTWNLVLDITGCPAGVYFVKVSTPNSLITKKIVKL